MQRKVLLIAAITFVATASVATYFLQPFIRRPKIAMNIDTEIGIQNSVPDYAKKPKIPLPSENQNVNEAPVELITFTDHSAGYKVAFPKGLSLGVPTESGNMCSPVLGDVDGESFPYFNTEDCGGPYISIIASKNKLGMSAIDFGKRSLGANRANGSKSYSDDGEIKIGGINAFAFRANGLFEERGRSYGFNNESLDDSSLHENVGWSGFTGRVMYLDHNGYIITIMISDNETVKKIVDSIKFF